MPQRQPLLHQDAVLPSPEAANQEASLQHARLVMSDGARYAALTSQGTRWVALAAGCLLQPAIGDLALISLAGTEGYILTVLERGTPDAAAQVSVPGDLQLSVPHGRLILSATEGVALNAGPALDIATAQFTAVAQHADVNCQTLEITGDTVHTQWHARTDVVSEHLEIATRRESHTQQSVRRVTGHEEVTAQSMRHTVEQNWAVSADTADVKARERVTVQAESVQLG